MTFASEWAIAEAGPLPSRARRLRRRDWEGFRERVDREDDAFCKAIVTSLYAGDCYILSNAFPREFMLKMRRDTLAYFRDHRSTFHKITEGAADFHRSIDLETGRNYSFHACKQTAYFFPWNDDPLDLYPTIYERWRVIKKLMGRDPCEWEKNTPKDGVIDRIQSVRYPSSIGYLEPHCDPHLYQRLFISGYMSKRGVDYDGGGFYLVGPNDEVMDGERDVEIGDIGIGYATVYHGVAPCNRGVEPSWTDSSGRWFLGLYSTVSDEVPDRHTGHPVKLNLPEVMP